MTRFEHDLRVRLRERRNRLYKASSQVFENEERLMLSWMESEPYLAALITEIEAAPIEYSEWKAQGISHRSLAFPDDELQRAKVCLGIVREHNWLAHGRAVSGERHFDDIVRDYTEHFVDPLVNFLEDRIDDGSSILGILDRYKRRSEWFHQADLHARYEADTTRGEAVLDAHLREYLVDQGIAYPFSQPASPSGEVDIVALGNEPLAIEVKLFLPSAGKDRAYIRKGFAQAHRYATDYGLPSAYLVVFNLSESALVVTGEKDRTWPPSISVGQQTVFVVTIDVNPNRPKASRDRRLARVEIDAEFMRAS